MIHAAVIEGRGAFEPWRDAARALLQAGIAPDAVDWRVFDAAEARLDFDALPVPAGGAGKTSAVPAAFLDLAAAAICHSDPARFALLFRLLWRLVHEERLLLRVHADADVAAARAMEKSVRRDAHKMTAFVRFREGGAPPGARRRFVAWFEPEHFIVARTAPFFQRRFTDMDWLIATPKGSAAWDGERLTVTPEPAARPEAEDATDDLWRIYYSNIFNPARLKVKAMQAEMPKKYWKNLPEARLIPELIAEAETRVAEMAARQATTPLPFHDRLQSSFPAETLPVPANNWEALRNQAMGCTRCPLHCHATQTVFGEGPGDAEVMIVGEQPGDQEDLAGRPFVGPAGKLFDRAAGEVGLDRRRLYVTNAVKHFKYEPRGKRRIHQKPNMGEIEHCRWWLAKEIDLVKPKLIVALGATAYAALTGERKPLSEVRGQTLAMEGDRALFVTVHPSYLLRIPDPQKKEVEWRNFLEDLKAVTCLMQAASMTEEDALPRARLAIP